MNPSPSPVHPLRPRILERRERLQAAAGALPADYVNDLLEEIDAALRKIDSGSYGLCETCHDPIEEDRLEHDPLLRFCLDHLTKEEQRAHEQDLALATQIQTRLLPATDVGAGDWETHYRYQPAGVVGGDYCDIVPCDGSSLFFAVGDVSGKGVAASLLMTHLSAIIRSLLSLELPLPEMISRANRLLCESTPATHYATIAAGRTDGHGVSLCNAGHCSPLLIRRDGIERIGAGGLPLGIFSDGPYQIRHVRLDPGDSLVLYSDGITEACDFAGEEYGEDRLIDTLRSLANRDAAAMAEGVLRDVAGFRAAGPRHDDMTLLIVRRRYSPDAS